MPKEFQTGIELHLISRLPCLVWSVSRIALRVHLLRESGHINVISFETGTGLDSAKDNLEL